MKEMHSLLERQIKRYFGDQFHIPKEWKEFIGAVNDAYCKSDVDRTMIERSLELSSQELIQTNSEMRAIFQAIPDLLFRLDNEGRILDYKAGATVDFLLQPKELIGKRIQDVPSQHVSQKFHEAIQQVLALKTMVSMEYPLFIKEQQHYYEARLLPLMEDQIIVVIRDITERKHAEEALRYERKLLRLLIDNIPDLMYTKDTASRKTLSNHADVRHLGAKSEAEVLGKDDFAFYPKELAEGFFADDQSVIQTGQALLNKEEYVLNEDGSKSWLLTSKLPLRDEKGYLVGLVGIGRDITERKQSEEELRYERNLLRILIDHLPDAVYVKDVECRKTVSNAADVHLMGRQSEAEILGKTDFDFYPAEDSAAYYADDKSVIRTGRPVINKEEFLTDKEGKGHWFSTSKLPLRDAQGRIIGLVGVGRDITERKNAEIALRESEQKFRGLVEGSAAAIWIHNTERFLYANPAGLEMAGYTAEELYKLTPMEIVHPDFRDYVMKRSRERLQGKDVAKHYEYQILKKSGEAIWIDFSGAEITYDGKPAIIASAYDITDRKKLEEQLLQAQKMDGIGRLAGGVAHDYNNILGVIIGYSELIMDKMKKADPVYNYVEMIASAAKRGADITRQLLAFARRETASPRVLNPNEAIESLQNILQRLIGENVKLIFLPQKRVWNVKIDRTQLDQILVNLATNARDAIDDVGTITIETSNISMDETYTQNRLDLFSGEYVMISFSDTGEGMSKETMQKIFEPFFTTKSKGQGTGLGLSMVYGIVKQNGGSIYVYSEAGSGTTFKIYLKRYYGEAEEPETAHVDESIFGSETVLIVEDQSDFLELARNSLQKYGYKVLTALSPGDGIRICETCEDEIHLLLTDVIMPAMNGKELRNKIQTIKPNIKTIFMSGYTANVIAHRGVLDEGVDFIQKPFSPYALALKVHEVLKS